MKNEILMMIYGIIFNFNNLAMYGEASRARRVATTMLRSEDEEDETISTMLICAGITIGLILIIASIITLIFLYRHCVNKKSSTTTKAVSIENLEAPSPTKTDVLCHPSTFCEASVRDQVPDVIGNQAAVADLKDESQ